MFRISNTSPKRFLACGVAAAALAGGGAAAKPFHLLYTFQNSTDGDQPEAGLIKDAAGNLFGTTNSGGNSGFSGDGTVYKLAPDGTKTELYSFTGGTDGNYPNPVILDASGNLFGTASQGGKNEACHGYGCGVVFEVTPSGTESVLYTFTGGNDGGNPNAALLPDGKGGFYGTAAQWGASLAGNVFHLSSAGKFSVIYSFAGGNDGDLPLSALIADKSGNMYGTTSYGGGACSTYGGCGTVYQVTPGGSETVLYAFTGGADGGNPVGGLIRDKAGNLYGTTEFGGAVNACGGTGCGTVFKISSGGAFSVLYTFTGGNDGGQPVATLVSDEAGNFYGTTLFWGADGYGVVFKLAPDGKEQVLHSFTNGDDGAYPWCSLLRVGKDFVGAAAGGGATDFGTLFKVRR